MSGEAQALLALRPVRLAEHEERDGRVVIERPLPPVRGLRSLLQRISALTGVRRLRLDERGSFVWLRIDGERTVGEIADDLLHGGPDTGDGAGGLREEAGERARRSVALFLHALAREGLVELRDPSGAPVRL